MFSDTYTCRQGLLVGQYGIYNSAAKYCLSYIMFMRMREAGIMLSFFAYRAIILCVNAMRKQFFYSYLFVHCLGFFGLSSSLMTCWNALSKDD